MPRIVPGASGLVGRHLHPVKGLPVTFNLASISSVEASIASPYTVIMNNIECMLEALNEARELKHWFVHLSTVEAEDPSNPYAASKAAQEAIALAYCNTYNMRVIIARSHNIIGEGQSEDKFVPKLIKQIKAGETVKIYGNGSRIYNPVENVVSALIYLSTSGESGRIYLITGGERLTNLEMAEKIAKLLGKPLKYELVAGRPGYRSYLESEGEMIPGWQPPFTLEESLTWIK